jgi:rfaE bifunctional protein nucleotidyltransferase chain/domain
MITSSETISSKIFESAENIETLLKTWRKAGETVVFTNGCFDLVHRGHINSLVKAAAFGDRLIVGLNTDSSVKRLKGSKRPIIAHESRAFLLASLMMVDAVVLFDEETPYELIRIIQPDVLVKGDDYSVENISGADLVLSTGGRIERIKLTEGFSTSQLIERIIEIKKES